MKKIKIKDTMWLRDVMLIISDDKQECINYIKKKYHVTLEVTNADASFFEINEKYFIWIHQFDWLISDQGLLAHELLHCVFCILRNLGFSLARESEEIYTYYFQLLWSEILKQLTKHLPPDYKGLNAKKNP